MTLPETTAHFQMLNNAKASYGHDYELHHAALSPKKILLNSQKLQETSSIFYQFSLSLYGRIPKISGKDGFW